MRTHARFGFSMPELLIVVIIIVVVAGLAAPRLSAFREQNDLNAAAAQVSSYIQRARATAIGRGRTVRFANSGNAIWVIIPSTGDTLGSRQDLNLDRKVTMSATHTNIDYSARGMASNLAAGAVPTFTLTRGGRTKKVCTNAYGMLQLTC